MHFPLWLFWGHWFLTRVHSQIALDSESLPHAPSLGRHEPGTSIHIFKVPLVILMPRVGGNPSLLLIRKHCYMWTGPKLSCELIVEERLLQSFALSTSRLKLQAQLGKPGAVLLTVGLLSRTPGPS